MDSYVVIGGGLAGLTAANALAGQGNKVTLFEKSRHLGGRAQSQYQNGYSLNLGPHALYREGYAARLFQEWQIPFSGNPPQAGSKGFFIRDNQFYPLVTNLSSLLTTRLFNLREKLEVANLLRLFTSGDADPGESMIDWLNQHVSSHRVREFAETIIRIATYTVELEYLSARAALRQIALAFKGNVLYLDGGWQTLVDGLARRASSLGVDIRCGEPVENLASIQATGIVLAVEPEVVEKLTGVSLPSRSALVATLDLCMRSMPKDAANVAFTIDRPLYYSVHSASAKLAPEGGALVHVAKYLGETVASPQDVRKELEEYATLVMPQWRELAASVRFLPNLRVSPLVYPPSGRPKVDCLDIENVLVAGDWVGEEGMLADAAVASAIKAVTEIQQRKIVAA